MGQEEEEEEEEEGGYEVCNHRRQKKNGKLDPLLHPIQQPSPLQRYELYKAQ